MLVTVIVFVVVLAGLGSSMLQVDLSISKSRRTETASQLAYFAAEAGIDHVAKPQAACPAAPALNKETERLA